MLVILFNHAGANNVPHDFVLPTNLPLGTTTPSDVIMGDAYPLSIGGTMFGRDKIIRARLVIKEAAGQPDAAALLDITVTSTVSSRGIISADGTGPKLVYQVYITLLPQDTWLLVNPGDPTPAAPTWSNSVFWEVRLTTLSGLEFTPVRSQSLLALPRLINAV